MLNYGSAQKIGHFRVCADPDDPPAQTLVDRGGGCPYVPRLKPGTDVALDLLHKYNTGFILAFRFIYVVRNFSSFACGMSNLFWPRFMMLNFVAAGVWSCTFAGAGYLLGEVFTKAAWPIKIVVLCLFATLIVLAIRAHRANKRRVAEAAAREAAEAKSIENSPA